MKPENKEKINKIGPAIQDIVKSECESIYAEYEALKNQSAVNELKIKDLERDVEGKSKSIKMIHERLNNARTCLGELSKDGLVMMFEDGYSCCDEYGNEGGYRLELVEYKGVQYELMYDSF